MKLLAIHAQARCPLQNELLGLWLLVFPSYDNAHTSRKTVQYVKHTRKISPMQVYDYFLESREGGTLCFRRWAELIPKITTLPGKTPPHLLVPTVDTVRFTFMLKVPPLLHPAPHI